MIVDKALREARSVLRFDSDAPSLDAERLVLHAMGRREPSWLAAHGDEQLPDAAAAHLASLVRRRQTGEPLAYILNEWEFYGRRFFIDEQVLVPRPDTEMLVERALEYVLRQARPLIIADIGTGSGCVVITLALELATVISLPAFIATDISPATLSVAKRNAKKFRVLDKIEFIQSNMLDFLKGRKTMVDLIVSNPPYVTSQELAQAGQTPDTIGLTFEPKVALDGGSDGQNFIRQIAVSGIPAFVEVTGGRVQEFNVA
ncbi:MAG: hypothetical protein COT71_01305 [Candidatus Andersenbacteria bacterium CG10_big_fil_rev_8_21_14_0_10_54_11]|uniref:Peptide chain release factor N(5)-glutamine methyltransferase n=1 Tax=Candidatus Andersenbacteria bacterium CG10_big_fil_rev_8_21_14_0_10_54_11 TaxID=1974485 RepID=A0A2M6WZZ0_9BACT|nr:MAG: hypothetical protein COT71_01305 [Candidatus Andersenbacteria bacterium CG10_big_fil_rev_8_21_14_0_10_54_11]